MIEGKQRSVMNDFPHYRRSPRTTMNIPEETVEIQKPPAKKEMDKKGLVQIIISPLVMLCITIAISVIMKRGIYVIVSVAGTVLSTVMAIIKYISDRRACRRQNDKREELYDEYLLGVRRQLSGLKKQEEEAYRYRYPSVKQISHMIRRYDSRIYERSHTDEDFLCISLGYRQAEASFQVKFDYDQLNMEPDPLMVEAKQIVEQFTQIRNQPVIADLKRSNLGLVGSKENIHEQLKLLIAQIVFEHSYHDVELIHIYDQSYEEDFHYLRWYPHCRIRAVNVIGNISTDASRDQILGSVYRILRERRQKLEENNKVSRYLPHYLFVIDEPKLIMDHAIMEFLEKSMPELGFSIIYTSHMVANLPENITTILSLDGADEATLVIKDGRTLNTHISLQRAGEIDFEWLARDLSVLVHESGVMAQIPESVTFFEMYQVSSPQELDVRKRWQKSDSHKTLAVPLGMRSREEYVQLNLHEKAHGPHGLVAGTTGSGKSELVQSYILSLAVNFHPYEVAFLLIDYKGGGMANLFRELPHLVGTITNLDGAQSMRALVSIKSELARRQRIFGEYDVNHINAYNKLYKEGKAGEPIPHLFIISDEFAELKKEQPEFMTELVSAARIGRSLGVHLILATQKPSGVVDDQIWTNSKFRIALKVQNESDSKEILRTPDAAGITQAGRAYLQVGNNEIYELFQSAWSGALYSGEQGEEIKDNRIYRLNGLGQREVINADLSRDKEQGSGRQTQLDVTVRYIRQSFDESGLPPVKKPWLEPLPDALISPYFTQTMEDGMQTELLTLAAPIGIADIPEQQKQEEYCHDFAQDGNLAIFGASGFGKSTALTTLLLTLASQNSPALFQCYIVDLGNSALLPLKKLPHTADYIGMDDLEKLAKLMQMIPKEIRRRKSLFLQNCAINFEMYNNISEQKLPGVLMVIDNYDVVREISMDYEGILNQISRDGIGVGIYVVITATRPGAVRFNVLNNFKTKLAFFMIDKMDVGSVVGKTRYPLDEIRGRALVKQEEAHQMQIYLAAEAENAMKYVAGIQILVGRLDSAYQGIRPEPIPMLPEKLEYEQLSGYLTAQDTAGDIPIGLDVEQVRPQYLSTDKGRCIIVGTGQSGKTNLLRLVLEGCRDSHEILLIDTREGELEQYSSLERLTYCHTAGELSKITERMEQILQERTGAYEEEKKRNPALSFRNYSAHLPAVLVLIEDWDNFLAFVTAIKYQGIEKLFAELLSVHVFFITTTLSSKMRGYDAATKWIRESRYGVILGQPSEQNIFSISTRRQEQIETGIAHLVDKNCVTRLLTAKVQLVGER